MKILILFALCFSLFANDDLPIHTLMVEPGEQTTEFKVEANQGIYLLNFELLCPSQDLQECGVDGHVLFIELDENNQYDDVNPIYLSNSEVIRIPATPERSARGGLFFITLRRGKIVFGKPYSIPVIDPI